LKDIGDVLRTINLALVALSGCSSSSQLTGNAEEDFAALTAATDVDCSAEPQCGPVPHCLRDALRDGTIGMFQRTAEAIVSGTGQRETYPQYLFTYDGALIQIDDRRTTTDNPHAAEMRCPDRRRGNGN
jgi:hypothetical protein